jgi:predicted kinase
MEIKMSYVIIIAGISASGKTVYARHISEKLNIPLIARDSIKEKLHDVIRFDNIKRETSKLYGTASYSVLFHIAECLMKADISFVLESNFSPASVDDLMPLVKLYNYKPLTVLFDADIEVLHKRFLERDKTGERPQALISKGADLDDFENFRIGTLPLKDFCIGKKITVDTTDFSKVDYDEIDNLVIEYIKG